MIGGSACGLRLRVARQAAQVAPRRCSRQPGRPLARGRPDHRGGSRDAGLDYRVAVNEIYRHTFGKHADSVEPGSSRRATSACPTSTTSRRRTAASPPIPTWPNGTAAAEVEVDRRPACAGSSSTASSRTPGGSSTRCWPTPTSTAHRAGDRLRHVRGARLRRLGPAPDRDADGLHDPDRGGAAEVRDRAPGDAVALLAAGHQGCGRVRHRRDARRALQRGRERVPRAGPRPDRPADDAQSIWRAIRDARERAAPNPSEVVRP